MFLHLMRIWWYDDDDIDDGDNDGDDDEDEDIYGQGKYEDGWDGDGCKVMCVRESP